MKNKDHLTDEEVCKAIIALANLVVAENHGNNIKFVRRRHDNNERN